MEEIPHKHIVRKKANRRYVQQWMGLSRPQHMQMKSGPKNSEMKEMPMAAKIQLMDHRIMR